MTTTHTEGMNPELLPCLFCGSENISLSTLDYRWICMTCADCGSSCGDVRSKAGDSNAIEAWNTRPSQPSEAAIRNAALEEAVISAQHWPLRNKDKRFDNDECKLVAYYISKDIHTLQSDHACSAAQPLEGE